MVAHVSRINPATPPDSSILWHLPDKSLQHGKQQKTRQDSPIPRCSMYGICTYIWLIFIGNLGITHINIYHTWILQDMDYIVRQISSVHSN